VRCAAALVVIDDDHDPFNKVNWNSGECYRRRQHLFDKLGIAQIGG
jgi:hypothetical protein